MFIVESHQSWRIIWRINRRNTLEDNNMLLQCSSTGDRAGSAAEHHANHPRLSLDVRLTIATRLETGDWDSAVITRWRACRRGAWRGVASTEPPSPSPSLPSPRRHVVTKQGDMVELAVVRYTHTGPRDDRCWCSMEGRRPRSMEVGGARAPSPLAVPGPMFRTEPILDWYLPPNNRNGQILSSSG